jgi:hypothetical protein
VKHDIPPALPQEQDRDNWNAFRDAAKALLHLSYVRNLSYFDWEQFNLICNGKTSGIPDRRHPGDPAAVPSSFYGNQENAKDLVSYFYLSSAQFMNLCDDLHALAGMVGGMNTDALWDALLSKLTSLVKNDVSTDWSKPAARALLQLCHGPAVRSKLEAAKNSMTCTITLS